MAFLLTVVSGTVLINADDDFAAAERAARYGDPDPVLAREPGAFAAALILQMGVVIAVSLTGSTRLARLAAPLAWALFGLWLLLYLVYFRPAG